MGDFWKKMVRHFRKAKECDVDERVTSKSSRKTTMKKSEKIKNDIISFNTDDYIVSAESEGFEPPEVLPSTVFKTAAIDHSANSPRQK